jgi:SPP1 gp7 family putative phage head morphogenesis protein
MNNAEYWKKRFEQIEVAANSEALSVYEDIQRQYIEAQKEIENQISRWYARFAQNNQITMAEARRLLTSKELDEFKWSLEEYIKYGKENALNQTWMKQLENASARYHVTRLEALKINMQQTVEKLFGNQTDALDKLVQKNYLGTYYHTAFELQKGLNIGWNISAVDDRVLKNLINKPWATDGKTLSDRLWTNKSSLITELQTQLSQNILLGRSPDESIRVIADKMGVSKRQAGRLVMTESAYFSSVSQGDAFRELDVEQYEIVATLDSKTSEICQDLDGKVFDMKSYEPGVTAPPFHPWCRTVTAPYFEDDAAGKRAARGADGKTYYIDSNTKYADWKKTFVENGSKEGLQEITGSDILKGNQYAKDYNCDLAQKFGTGYYDEIHQKVVDCPDSNLAKAWQKNESQINVADAAYKGHEHCSGSSIYVNGSTDAKGSNWSAPFQTTFHESGHAIDYLNRSKGTGMGNHFSATYKNGLFPNTIKQEVGDIISEIDSRLKADFKVHSTDYKWLFENGFISEWSWYSYQKYGFWTGQAPSYSKSMAYRTLEKEIKGIALERAKADISDILEGATSAKISCGYGHGANYWPQRTFGGVADGLATEAFAEIIDSTMTNPESLEVIKKYLPKSYQIFCDMIQELAK